MSKQIDVFVHREGDRPIPVAAEMDEPLTTVLRRAGIETEPSGFVFVGESEHALSDQVADNGNGDDHDPVDTTLDVHESGLAKGRHVHCHRCRHITVAVNYGGRHKHHKFSPAATVATATEWAKRKFNLTDNDATTYVLQVCDSTRRPRPNEHLGELVRFPNCELCFDLVPDKTKIEG